MQHLSLILGLVCLAALGAYANAFGHVFMRDDFGVIVNNPLVTSPSQSWRAFLSPYWPPEIGGGQYRPAVIVSFGLDWLVSGGSPLWFHAVTIAWHAVASALVAALALVAVGPVAALVAGLVFAVHPVHAEAVASVVGRAEAMAGAGVLAALLLHLKGSTLAMPAFLFALLSKEHAIMFPLLALVHDRLVGPQPQRARLLYGGYLAISMAWLAVVALLFRDQAFSDTPSRFVGTSVVERLPTVMAVVPHYARLLVAPFSLSGDYEPQVIPEPAGITEAQIVGVLTLMAAGVVLLVAWRRAPRVAFALVWIPLAIAPVSNVLLPTGVTLAERTLYLASMGACWLAGMAIAALWARRRAVAAGLSTAVMLGFAARTWTRTPVWENDRSYLLELIQSHPESYRARWAAGLMMVRAGNIRRAEAELAAARRLFWRDYTLLAQSTELARLIGDTAQAAALEDSARLVSRRGGRFTVRRNATVTH